MAHSLSAAAPAVSNNPFVRAVSRLSQLCGIAASLMILASVLITCQMIFVRFVLNQSTIWQTELVVYLMVAATLVGLPYVQLHRAHVNVDLIPNMLPPRGRKLLQSLTLMAAIAVIGCMLFYGSEMWHLAWSRGWKSDTVWGVRQWIPYLAMPVGFAVFLLQLLADLLCLWRTEDQPEAAAEAP